MLGFILTGRPLQRIESAAGGDAQKRERLRQNQRHAQQLGRALQVGVHVVPLDGHVHAHRHARLLHGHAHEVRPPDHVEVWKLRRDLVRDKAAEIAVGR